LSKCTFAASSIDFLGYRITPEGICPLSARLQAINQWPVPSSREQLQSFMGFVNYYRKFIDHFTDIAEPLYGSMNKTPFSWGSPQETAFAKMKEAFRKAPILVHPNFKKPFIIDTDASTAAIGGAILQEVEGEERPIAFVSKKLSDAERKYAAHELELFAITYCCKQFRCYVEGNRFTVRTDHASLKHFLTSKTVPLRVTRWIEFLQSMMPFEIIYRKGSENIVADGLSRMHHVNLLVKDWPLLVPLLQAGQAIPELTAAEDDNISAAKAIEIAKSESDKFSYEDGTVFRKHNDQRLQYIPFVNRLDTVAKLHHQLGHLRWEAIYSKMKTRYWWPNMRKDVKTWIKACPICMEFAKQAPNKVPIQPFPVVPIFSRWGIDLIGPISPTSDRGHRWIILGVEYASRWIEAAPLREASAEEVANFIRKRIVLQFGAPDELVSDRGPNLMSRVVEKYLKDMKIRHCLTTPYHPRSNGEAERANGLILQILRRLCVDQKNSWDLFLDAAVYASRVRKHETTGCSPFQLVYGKESKLLSDPSCPSMIVEPSNPSRSVEARLSELSKVQMKREEASMNWEKSRAKMKRRIPKQSYVPNAGDIVTVPEFVRSKLGPTRKGPYVVTEVNPQKNLVRLNDHIGRPIPGWISTSNIQKTPVDPRSFGNWNESRSRWGGMLRYTSGV
jgi:transposase InsO family protein